VAILSRADACCSNQPCLTDFESLWLYSERAIIGSSFSPASTSYPAIVDVAVALTQGMSEDETGLRGLGLA